MQSQQQSQEPQEPNRVNSASPLPTPSSSPGAMSLPQGSEWSGGSEWSLGGSAQSSRAPSPYPSMGLSYPEQLSNLANFSNMLQMMMTRRIHPQVPSPCPTPAPSSEPSSSRPASPAVPPKKKIPRPANAFMLFRSDLIKTNAIPKSVEPRQQNISRVAGQCWNMLPPEKRKYWHDKAAEALRKHKEKHPDYKFSPERKRPSRKNAPGEGELQPSGEDRIRWIRETYIGMSGPPIAPSRPRKPRSRRGADSQDRFTPPPMHFSLPPSLQPSPTGTPDIPRVASAPPYLALSPEAHLAALGAHGIPDYSSLPPPGPGFPHNFPSEYFAQYLAPPSQPEPQGTDSIPNTQTFNDPTQAKFTFNLSGEGSSQANLGLAPPYGTTAGASVSASQPQPQAEEAPAPAPSRSTSPGRWSALESYLAPPILGDVSSPHDALNVSLDARSAYGTDVVGTLDDSELDAWYHA